MDVPHLPSLNVEPTSCLPGVLADHTIDAYAVLVTCSGGAEWLLAFLERIGAQVAILVAGPDVGLLRLIWWSSWVENGCVVRLVLPVGRRPCPGRGKGTRGQWVERAGCVGSGGGHWRSSSVC